MKTTAIEVGVHYFGKKRLDGVSCFKIGEGAEYLRRHGWRVVKRTSSYTYMVPPERVHLRRGERPKIRLDVPVRDDIEALATALHEKGQQVTTTLCGWPVLYKPSFAGPLRITLWSLDGIPTDREIWCFEPAIFECGSFELLWQICCEWTQGEDAPPEWRTLTADGAKRSADSGLTWTVI
jgi:hypothetical protein